MKKKLILGLGVIAIVLVGVLIFTSRDQQTTVTEIETKSDGEKITIVTSFYPLEYFTTRIAGEYAEVVNIGKNSDPHEFTPSVNDVLAMQSADIVFLQGAGLESWGEDMEAQLASKNVPVYVIAENIAVHKMEEHEHEGEDEEKHHETEDEHGHNHGEWDPHTWLDPVLAADTVSKIVAEIITIDPLHQDEYRKNAEALVTELTALDTAYKTGFSTCAADEILVSHDAFGYISRRYNLAMHPIAGISTQDEPSAVLLAELKAEAEEGVLGILTEENSVKEYAETIARETGIAIIPINALESGVIENGGDYMDGMRTNLKALQQGYGCSS